MMEILIFIAWAIVAIIGTTYLYYLYIIVRIKISTYIIYYKMKNSKHPEIKRLAKDFKKTMDSKIK